MICIFVCSLNGSIVGLAVGDEELENGIAATVSVGGPEIEEDGKSVGIEDRWSDGLVGKCDGDPVGKSDELAEGVTEGPDDCSAEG